MDPKSFIFFDDFYAAEVGKDMTNVYTCGSVRRTCAIAPVSDIATFVPIPEKHFYYKDSLHVYTSWNSSLQVVEGADPLDIIICTQKEQCDIKSGNKKFRYGKLVQ